MNQNKLDRYAKNKTMFSDAEIDTLHEKNVCVIGCGGLGGYIIEMLGRLGVGTLTVIDGDVFNVTNLNRQLYATEPLIGVSKAKSAAVRMNLINPEVEVIAHHIFVSHENVHFLLEHQDIVVDALDCIEMRKCVAAACSDIGIPFIHGAIAGWYGQVATIFPGEHTLDALYKSTADKGDESNLGNPSFTPALVASIQVSEAIKVLLGRGDVLRNKFMHIDLLANEFNIFEV